MRIAHLGLLVAAVAAAISPPQHFGPDDSALRVAIVCGLHPREAFARDLCARWAAHWTADPPARLRITLVADANPEGTAIWAANASMACWRGNGRGVDLNRNWPVPPLCAGAPPPDADAVAEAAWPAGPAPLSEPETRALAALLLDDAPDILIAVHSGARALLTPYDACAASPRLLPRAMQLGRWLRADVCDDCTLGVSSRLMYRSRGTLTDWAHGVAGIPFVYTLEAWAPATAEAAQACETAFSPPRNTLAYADALRTWDALAARLADMDGDTWATLLRWLGVVA